MLKQYILAVCLMMGLTACDEEDKINLENIEKARVEVNHMIDDSSTNDFFASKEYDGGKKEDKCIDESGGNFEQLTYCLEDNIAIIKEKIKKKLKILNQSEKILEAEYQKIKTQCRKEAIASLKEDGDDVDEEGDALTINLFTAGCIKNELYQFGRNLN
ncbi:MAG: hypothetical protein N4Q30_00830 [Neisseriaceae bacterium]|nr:hypothetical protein [Neisseriaceae bacterium]